jgi:hypothetical protein
VEVSDERVLRLGLPGGRQVGHRAVQPPQHLLLAAGLHRPADHVDRVFVPLSADEGGDLQGESGGTQQRAVDGQDVGDGELNSAKPNPASRVIKSRNQDVLA